MTEKGGTDERRVINRLKMRQLRVLLNPGGGRSCFLRGVPLPWAENEVAMKALGCILWVSRMSRRRVWRLRHDHHGATLHDLDKRSRRHLERTAGRRVVGRLSE